AEGLHLFNAAADEIRGTTLDASKDIDKLFTAFAKSDKSKQATKDLTDGLKRVRNGLDETNPAGAKAIETINRVIDAVEKGAHLPPVVVQFLIDFKEREQQRKAEQAARKISDAFLIEVKRHNTEATQVGADLAAHVTAGMQGSLALARARAAGDTQGELAELN